jgi:putative FmdB family regulatory protein
MPTYAYRGKVCDHEFEVRQSFSDDPITECQVCGQPVRRVIHPAGIVFKGTGWYITDSRPTTDTSGGVQDASKVASKSPESTDSAAASPKKESAAAPAAAD